MQFKRDTYSYLWPRDGALVAHALDLAGYPRRRSALLPLLRRRHHAGRLPPAQVQPGQSLASSWHPWVVERPGRSCRSRRTRPRSSCGRCGSTSSATATSIDEAAVRAAGAPGRRLHGALPRAAHGAAGAVLRSVGGAARHPVVHLRLGLRRAGRCRRVRAQLRRAGPPSATRGRAPRSAPAMDALPVAPRARPLRAA